MGSLARKVGTAAPTRMPLKPKRPWRRELASASSRMAVVVAMTSATTAPAAIPGWPAETAPQAIAARKSAPVRGLFWKMTWPAPRRLTSRKRTAALSSASFVQAEVSGIRASRQAQRNRSGTRAPVTSWRTHDQNSRIFATTGADS